ncbi:MULTISPECIES: GNAT family N-acetyltransferase [unclassified Flavobacterium]|uniref:GNAT family N-acetyltransferase n=1 Tax=unclassified Flavobacterium TaxID=196869 RepID=UPI0009696480|nr:MULTISPECIES: GNAT family N-acetyltransferase [unclassified Flavobacterium]MBN9285444.1 N-acetyltransferase [Flavobacterium sp.]OJV71436.1 MAG: N-acetyltransferase [Flavobacterium sp. 40-81]
MNISIRPFTDSDLPYVLEIINHEIKNSVSIYDYEPRTLQEQEIIIQDKRKHDFPFLVAVINDVAVGFGTYGFFRFKEGYKYTVEHSIYIDQQHTGKGIGKLLLAELIAIAKAQNKHTMIGVIDTENTGSILFHQKSGFEMAGILKENAYKFDRWLDTAFLQLML